MTLCHVFRERVRRAGVGGIAKGRGVFAGTELWDPKVGRSNFTRKQGDLFVRSNHEIHDPDKKQDGRKFPLCIYFG